jgi:hypothetical protein
MRLIMVKDFVTKLFFFVVSASTVVSCSQASVAENPVTNEQSTVVTAIGKSSPTQQSANPENTYGIDVDAKSLCSDGINTTLILQTELDPEFWQLSETDFYPNGKVYFETSILFLENNEMYSTVSSGKRDDPVFDFQNHSVSTIQTFVFPKQPMPNSEFTIKANVTLGDLPGSYIPPAGVSLKEPGVIKVPIEYVASATLNQCP